VPPEAIVCRGRRLPRRSLRVGCLKSLRGRKKERKKEKEKEKENEIVKFGFQIELDLSTSNSPQAHRGRHQSESETSRPLIRLFLPASLNLEAGFAD
jgi:hypothetical protein